MEVWDKIVAILFSLSILANGIFLKRLVGTWLFPGCLFSLFWFCYTFFPLVILFDVPVNPLAIAFIAGMVITFSVTTLLFKWDKAFKANLEKPDPGIVFNTRFLNLTLWVSIAISVVASLFYVIVQGFGIVEFFSNPILVASKFADARYAEDLTYSVAGPISLLFSNISVIIGGLLFGAIKKNKKIYLAFLPSVIILLTQSSKGLFFLSVFLFLGGIMITKLFRSDFALFNKKIIRRLAYISAFFVVLLFISFLSRGLQDVEDKATMFNNLMGLFSSYFFCHVYGFSDWFTAYTGGDAAHTYDTSNYYLGFYTLTAFFRMLGTTKVTSPGVYDEFFTYKTLLESNIYTIFRGIIMDFGIIGGWVFMLINGFIVNLVYYVFLRRNRPLLTTMFLIFMLGYFYMSFIISMLTWVIIPFTFVVCYMILKFNSYDIGLKNAVKK